MGHFLRFSGLTTSPERRISKFKWSPLIFNSQWECEVVWKKITHRWHRAGRKVRSEFLVFTGCSLWSSVNVVLRILSLAVIHVHLYFILYSEMVFLKNRKVLLKRWERVKKKQQEAKFLVYLYFLLKEWKVWSVILVDVWKETVQHLHHNLESLSHLNNM